MGKNDDNENFFVRGEIYRDHMTLPINMTGHYTLDGYDPVRCTLLLPEEHDAFPDLIIKDKRRRILQVRARRDGYREIWIPRLRYDSFSSEHIYFKIKGTAELYVEGHLAEIHEPKGKMTCYLILPKTELVFLERDLAYEYERQFPPEDEPTSITWETAFGRAELVRTYRTTGEIIGVHRATTETQQPAIKIEIDAGKYTTITDLIEKLRQDQDNVCWLLSFLSKKRIMWYGGALLYEPLAESADTARFIMLRRQAFIRPGEQAGVNEHVSDLLVPPETLRNGIFNRMVKTFEDLPNQQAFLQIMQYLVATYDDLYFEARYGLIWTAFEILVNTLSFQEGIANNLSNRKFEDLRESLKKVIEDELRDSTPEDIREDIKRKLPELRRRPLKSKVENLLTKHQVNIDELWPADTDDVLDALRDLIQRRNAYIHRGEIENFFANNQDLHRLRYLISIWMLKLLDYPIEQINEHDGDLWYAQRREDELVW